MVRIDEEKQIKQEGRVRRRVRKRKHERRGGGLLSRVEYPSRLPRTQSTNAHLHLTIHPHTTKPSLGILDQETSPHTVQHQKMSPVFFGNPPPPIQCIHLPTPLEKKKENPPKNQKTGRTSANLHIRSEEKSRVEILGNSPKWPNGSSLMMMMRFSFRPQGRRKQQEKKGEEQGNPGTPF